MNILFLALDIELTTQRGDAIHTVELARALAARGHTVDLVTATPETSLPDLGVGVHHHARRRGSDPVIVRECVGIARRARSEIVYERRLSPKIAFAVSRLAGVPFVMEINGSEEELEVQGRRRSALDPVKRSARRRMFLQAAGIVAVTRPLAEEVSTRYRLPPERVTVVPNGVDPTAFMSSDRDRARNALKVPAGHWILFVGNLAPWQGLDTVLAAISILRREDPDARLSIVGDGPSRAALEQKCRDLDVGGITAFRGAVPHEEIPAHIAASDVCVLPSQRRMNERVGRSPLKLFEYMASARPVVASDVPGVRDVVEQSGGGLLVPPDDSAAFSAALVRLLQNPEVAHAMGERGRRYVLAERTWARTAENVEAILRESLGARGREGIPPLA